MMMMMSSFMTVFALAVVSTFALALPLDRRDVVSPPITSPTKDSVWPVGSVQTVTWDTSGLPANDSQITNLHGRILLGFEENDSLNLDFEHPLAQGFSIRAGSVQVTVPSVPPKDDYLIVLMGNSGNTSPTFAITRISAPGSNSTTSSTTTTNPAPAPSASSSTTQDGQSPIANVTGNSAIQPNPASTAQVGPVSAATTTTSAAPGTGTLGALNGALPRHAASLSFTFGCSAVLLSWFL